MLFQAILEKIKITFPELNFSIDEKDKSITIPSKSIDVGDIVIIDDSVEMTIYVGNFTHWHASCYEESLNAEKKEKLIVAKL